MSSTEESADDEIAQENSLTSIGQRHTVFHYVMTIVIVNFLMLVGGLQHISDYIQDRNGGKSLHL